MNKSVELAYVSTRRLLTAFSELDVVKLVRPVVDREGRSIERGSLGAIVAVYERDAYEVEFVEPLQIFATVGSEDIERSS